MTGTALVLAKQGERFDVQLSDDAAKQIAALAPAGTKPEHYIASLQLYLAENPKLGGCRPATVLNGMLRIAQTGLQLGVSCDLLAFKVKEQYVCQFSPRYNGLVELALASGARSVEADVVREGDIFEHEKGTRQVLRHVRTGSADRPITHAYAIAELGRGSFVFEVLTREEIEATRARYSQQWKSGTLDAIPWYAKKTAIRRLAPRLPKNPRLAAALQYAEETERIDIETGEILGPANPVTPTAAAPAPPAGQAAPAVPLLSVAQRRMLFARKDAAGLDDAEFKEVLKECAGTESTKELPAECLDQVLEGIAVKGREKLAASRREAPAPKDDDSDLPY